MNTRTKLLCTVLLAMAAPAWADQSAKLHGDWHCLTRYDDINAEVRDNVRFDADNMVTLQGKMIFKFNQQEFHYIMPSRGTWRLQGNLLTLTLTDGKLESAHPAATRKAIAAEEAMFTYDQMTKHILSSNKPDENIYLRIDELTPDTMRQTQFEKSNFQTEMAKTVCSRRGQDPLPQ